MKLKDLFKPLKTHDDLGVENDIDKNSTPMKLPSFLDKHDYGKSKKLKREKVIVADTKTGRVYGSRMIWQREL